MSLSLTTKQVYSEVDEFLELLPENERNNIPQSLRDFFKREKDNEYKKGIVANVPIKEQNLKQDTLAIIALLNLKYWCNDELERKRLEKIYLDNEKKYQEFLQTKFDYNQIFNKKQSVKENVSIVEYNESIIKKIINKIKRIFAK